MEILTFPIKPVAKGRPRVALRGRFAHAYTPQKTRDFEDEIRILARKQWKKPPIVGPVEVEIMFCFQNPRVTKKTQFKEPHIKRPDCDNLAKGICDALNEITWFDDSQIWKITIQKIMVRTQKEVGIILGIS